ncbi:MAG: hypothetical protein HXK16_01885 [Alloprevotella sp.]|nr:hypothetical protein [Alloprevotella sp.]
MKLLFLTSLLSILPTASQSLSAHCATPQTKADSVTTSKRHAKVESTREGSRSRYRAQGYRIQVFTGGNDRAAKLAAQDMKIKVQRYFPELSVYIHFQSPR